MWIEFLNDNKIPYTTDTSADRLLIFGRDVQKDTVYSWIKKSKKYNLTSRQIFNTIQYSLPFEVLTEMSIEELLERNLTNHTKYLYYKKLKKSRNLNLLGGRREMGTGSYQSSRIRKENSHPGGYK